MCSGGRATWTRSEVRFRRLFPSRSRTVSSGRYVPFRRHRDKVVVSALMVPYRALRPTPVSVEFAPMSLVNVKVEAPETSVPAVAATWPSLGGAASTATLLSLRGFRRPPCRGGDVVGPAAGL